MVLATTKETPRLVILAHLDFFLFFIQIAQIVYGLPLQIQNLGSRV
jgi:hypothetical protein